MAQTPDKTRRIVLATAPDGMPKESDFRLETVPVPTPASGEVLVRTTWISVDPYMRGLMSGRSTYATPILPGAPVISGCVGEVVGSGDTVLGNWEWQEYVAVAAERLQKVDVAAAPASTALGILGVPGMTAYFGFLELCQPKAGETVVVSGAAGAVGSAVGQIAKIMGCRVVGSAGSEEKEAYLRALGFDGAINYKTDKPYAAALRRLCPNGIDCYFDNVGGDFTDAVFAQMNNFGRISVSGQISSYNNTRADVGPRLLWQAIVKQLRIEGFLVSRWYDRWPEGRAKMAEWLRDGKLRYEETVYEGLENAPRAFIGLFQGDNTGKAIVRVTS